MIFALNSKKKSYEKVDGQINDLGDTEEEGLLKLFHLYAHRFYNTTCIRIICLLSS